MNIFRDCSIASLIALFALAVPVVADEEATSQEPSLEVAPPQVQGSMATDRTSVPEPNTMLFAGIGGLILLVFVMRRK